jgi:hypothetical protein
MKRWKTVTVMSLGFICGVVWTAACDGTDSAKAAEGDTFNARAVLELTHDASGGECDSHEAMVEGSGISCCPSGFELVGFRSGGGGDKAALQVCLEG